MLLHIRHRSWHCCLEDGRLRTLRSVCLHRVGRLRLHLRRHGFSSSTAWQAICTGDDGSGPQGHTLEALWCNPWRGHSWRRRRTRWRRHHNWRRRLAEQREGVVCQSVCGIIIVALFEPELILQILCCALPIHCSTIAASWTPRMYLCMLLCCTVGSCVAHASTSVAVAMLHLQCR